MDDALKARLIGASILVVLAVLLLPELLSGPKDPASGAAGAKGTRVITIDLGGAVEASRAPRPDVAPEPAAQTPALPTVATPAVAANPTPDATTDLPEDTSEPDTTPVTEVTVKPDHADPGPTVPVTKASTPAGSAAKPAAAAEPAATATKPPAPTEVAPKPGAGSGKFAVQVGAFSSPDGARKLVSELKGAGYPAYIIAPAPGKKLHRVRVGPVADRGAADQLASKLKARGLPVAVTTDG